MTQRLAGKIALVTGASKGIGAAIALRLAADGAAVVVNYGSSKQAAEKVVADIAAAGGKAIAVQGDLADPQQVQTVLDETHKAYGGLDILVNNAGVYDFAPLAAITPEHFHKHFDLNVLGLLLTTQAAARILRDGGSVINISSAVSTIGPPNAAVYAASKAAVDSITASLAKELAPRKIRVNAVNPGMIVTEGLIAGGHHEGAMRDWAESATPLGRVGKAEEVAAVVAFVASDEASYVTGEIIHASGGFR